MKSASIQPVVVSVEHNDLDATIDSSVTAMVDAKDSNKLPEHAEGNSVQNCDESDVSRL
jgi:hypothetical protein